MKMTCLIFNRIRRREAGAAAPAHSRSGLEIASFTRPRSRDLDRAAELALSRCSFERVAKVDNSIDLWVRTRYLWRCAQYQTRE